MGRSLLQAGSIRRTKNEKGIPDHSNSAAIGGLGGCTEHIEFAQQSAINNTKHVIVSFLNFTQSINNPGHEFNHHSDHNNANHANFDGQFVFDRRLSERLSGQLHAYRYEREDLAACRRYLKIE